MPDRLIYRDYIALRAISLRTSGKSVHPTSEVSPNNADTLALSETNQEIEPRSLDNLSHPSGLLLARPSGNFATCGAKGIPRIG
jgi:hypothetical protein